MNLNKEIYEVKALKIYNLINTAIKIDIPTEKLLKL